jgi:2-hydroxy-4-carboxymuconate semialdehyde hemiacetal dehydrogenase
MTQVAIVGYGAIAGLHAAQLRKLPGVTVASVFGPDPEKARQFARSLDIAQSSDDLAAALEGMDAAIICSPSEHHFSQAQTAIERVPAVLVELPACGSAVEAEMLADAAMRRGVDLHCAHTSRYLRPYQEVAKRLLNSDIGSVLQVRYARSIPPRNKNWVDDALLHHGSHPLDLFLAWFGKLQPRGCVTFPPDGPPCEIALLAAIADGAPVSVSISYRSRLAVATTIVVGSKHTIETDGFSFVRSDRLDFKCEFDSESEYHAAISAQDRAFLSGHGVPWSEMLSLATAVDSFRKLAGNHTR